MKNTLKFIAALLFLAAFSTTKAQVPNDTQVLQQDSGNNQFAYYISHSATKNSIEVWDFGTQTIIAKDYCQGTVTTNGSGVATLTFPATFSSAPKISATVIAASGGTAYMVKVTSRTTSSVTVQVSQLTTVLGILTFTTNASGVDVDIKAMIN